MKIRIYIVDDHALFRKGLAALINAEQDMEVCGEGEDCGGSKGSRRREGTRGRAHCVPL